MCTCPSSNSPNICLSQGTGTGTGTTTGIVTGTGTGTVTGSRSGSGTGTAGAEAETWSFETTGRTPGAPEAVSPVLWPLQCRWKVGQTLFLQGTFSLPRIPPTGSFPSCDGENICNGKRAQT